MTWYEFDQITGIFLYKISIFYELNVNNYVIFFYKFDEIVCGFK